MTNTETDAVTAAYRTLIAERNRAERAGDRKAATALDEAVAALSAHPAMAQARDDALGAMIAETADLL